MLSRSIRRKVFERHGENCFYCGALATHIDHVRPRWWLEMHGLPENELDNLVPACARCNLMAGGKVFDSVEEKRNWIRKMLPKREIVQQRQEMSPYHFLAALIWLLIYYLLRSFF